MDPKAKFRYYGVGCMAYELFGQTHLVGEAELRAVGETFGATLNDYVQKRPEITKEMMCWGSEDMRKRPGSVPIGVRPIERLSVSRTQLTSMEKKFIDENLAEYPMGVIALALGVTSSTVMDYVRSSPTYVKKVGGGLYGEEDARALRKRFVQTLWDQHEGQ